MGNTMHMKVFSFAEELFEAKLIQRERRFFIEFVDNKTSYADIMAGRYKSEFAHTNNTGSMMGLIKKGRSILLSKAGNPARKLAYTLEAINLNKEGEKPLWLGVNTSVPNRFLQKLFLLNPAYEYRLLPFAKNFQHIKMEAKNGESRLDACLFADNGKNPQSPQKVQQAQRAQRVWIECKNVSMVEYDAAAFPDAVSERGQKHLETLMRLKEEGDRAVMFYVVQRTDAKCFMPADFIDNLYAEKLKKAYALGVEVYAAVADVQKDGIYFDGYLPLAPCYFKG